MVNGVNSRETRSKNSAGESRQGPKAQAAGVREGGGERGTAGLGSRVDVLLADP